MSLELIADVAPSWTILRYTILLFRHCRHAAKMASRSNYFTIPSSPTLSPVANKSVVITLSSSPGLPCSPPRVQKQSLSHIGLKSGSNVAEIPRDAILGFTNARLLRDDGEPDLANTRSIGIDGTADYRGREGSAASGDSGKENKDAEKAKEGRLIKPIKPKAPARNRTKVGSLGIAEDRGALVEKAAPKPRKKKTVEQARDEEGNLVVIKKAVRKPRQTTKARAPTSPVSRESEMKNPETVRDEGVALLAHDPSPHLGKATGKRKRAAKGSNTAPKKQTKKLGLRIDSLGQSNELQPQTRAAAELESAANSVSSRPVLAVLDLDTRLDLEPAPKRRVSWTPVRDLGLSDLPLTSVHTEKDDEQVKSFSNLLGKFKHKEDGGFSDQSTVKQPGPSKTTKKRMIPAAETVAMKKAPTTLKAKIPVEKPNKPKSPKKRLQTITALATEAYRPQVAEQLLEPDNAQILVTDYLITGDAAVANPDADESQQADLVEPKKKARKPTKSKKVKIREPEPVYVLPSPEAARRRMQAQDFLFGTSSQLAADQSPTFLRQVQEAIRLSEAEPSIFGTQTSPENSPTRVPSAPHGTSLGQGTSRLWSKAARDDNSTMFGGGPVIPRHPKDMEVVLAPGLENSFNPTHLSELPESPISELHDSGFVDIARASPPTVDKAVACKDNAAPNIVDIISSSPFRSLPSDSEEPTQSGVAADVQKDLPISVESAAPTYLQQATIPKRPRGRPRKHGTGSSPKARTDHKLAKTSQRQAKKKSKAASASSDQTIWLNIDEIMDSEAESLPSPPRRRTTSNSPPTSPQTLQLHDSTGAIVPAAIDPPAQLETMTSSLFPQITRTIKAQPRTKDPSRPSWHEKMLMYDPIVLEDLTGWLNAQGLRIETSRPAPKTSGKGKKKKGVGREDDGKPGLVNEKVMEELKPSIVQKWCEWNSVCCLYKEGLRGGVRKVY